MDKTSRILSVRNSIRAGSGDLVASLPPTSYNCSILIGVVGRLEGRHRAGGDAKGTTNRGGDGGVNKALTILNRLLYGSMRPEEVR